MTFDEDPHIQLEARLLASDTGRRIEVWVYDDTTSEPEWVELAFDSPRTVAGLGAFFVDESKDGGVCATPRSWRVFWLDGTKWVPVRLADGAFFFNTPDAMNEVRFQAVRTPALRVELQLRDGRSGGLHELQVIDAP